MSVPFSDEALEEIVARVRTKFATKPKVAIAGFGKSGKSSLFNAIYGEKIARVSMRTDETSEAQTAERFGVDFTDTPGIGTGKFSLDKVVEMGVLDKQHVVIHVLNGAAAISSEDERLHDLIGRSTAARISVVNKVDVLDAKERAEFAQSMKDKLGLSDGDYLFVSAKRGSGVQELIKRIVETIPEAMQDAFIAQQQADMAMKERRIRALIYSKAAVCAGIALVPIPIADVLVITPIQLAMVTAIGYFHGVEVGRKQAVELMTTLGAGVGLREAARQLVKLVPGYLSAVNAAMAFAGTVALGEAANVWFKKRMTVTADDLREIYRKVAEKAKAAYREQPQVVEVQAKVAELRRRLNEGEIDQAEFDRLLAELELQHDTPPASDDLPN